jgi:hypothetical protein
MQAMVVLEVERNGTAQLEAQDQEQLMKDLMVALLAFLVTAEVEVEVLHKPEQMHLEIRGVMAEMVLLLPLQDLQSLGQVVGEVEQEFHKAEPPVWVVLVVEEILVLPHSLTVRMEKQILAAAAVLLVREQLESEQLALAVLV